MDLRDVRTTADAVRHEIGKVIVGQDAAIELLLTSLLAGGHILIEGVPGTGKTMLAQAFAATLSLQFGRVQFTPDMMPGDVLGTSLFNFQTGEFTLTPGPIFTQILLADEVNRTPPKTQAALLQAMNERAVTIDTHTHLLGDDFMVVATQNPIEQHGTYPLPEAQLDRFLFKITIDYPTRDEERAIVARHGHQSSMPKIGDFDLKPVAGTDVLAELRRLTAAIKLEQSIIDYIVDVMRATRAHPAIETGASPRAANMLASAVRAYAALNGRDFVLPDDVKRLAVPLVRHRIVMAPHAEIDGLSSDRVLGEILDQQAAPRVTFVATSDDTPAAQIGTDQAALRPTRRAVLLFASALPLTCLILAWKSALWTVSFAYALMVLAIIAADALLILRKRNVEIGVTEPVRLPVGEEGQIRVDLSTGSDLRATRMTMVLEQTGPAEVPVVASAQMRRGRLAVALPVRSLRRGRIGLDALWLRWPGPLGLVEQRWRKVLGLAVDVVPVIRGLRGAALSVVMDDAQFGAKSQLQQGEGSEFETLREHVQGLDNRHIDWKRSARHNKLLSKVFRTERNHQIVFAFDTGHLMLEPIDGKARLDHAIEAALLLGWISLKSGDLVGSFAFDSGVRQYLTPAAGIAYLSRIQQAAARLAYSNEETNFTLGLAELNQRLKRRALVVLFTEFVDTVTAELLLESVQRIASRHAVIFVTLRDPLMARLVGAAPDGFMPVARTVIAHDLLRERAIVLERLGRMGVNVLDVAAGTVSTALVNRYLLVKQRGQL